jgi:hypothetical protein
MHCSNGKSRHASTLHTRHGWYLICFLVGPRHVHKECHRVCEAWHTPDGMLKLLSFLLISCGKSSGAVLFAHSCVIANFVSVAKAIFVAPYLPSAAVYVSIRPHTSAYVNACLTSGHVHHCIRTHTTIAVDTHTHTQPIKIINKDLQICNL